jgi:hypothetical protein
MREAVQVATAVVEVVDVADVGVASARARETNGVKETQKRVDFMIASVGSERGKEINDNNVKNLNCATYKYSNRSSLG